MKSHREDVESGQEVSQCMSLCLSHGIDGSSVAVCSWIVSGLSIANHVPKSRK
jgi:hypothetical protein